MLNNVAVLIGDTKAKRASVLADGLREASFGTTHIALSLEEVESKLKSEDVDVAILADTLGGKVFDLIRDVRQMRVGKNPFMTMFCALAPEHVDGAKLGLLAGVDKYGFALRGLEREIAMGSTDSKARAWCSCCKLRRK